MRRANPPDVIRLPVPAGLTAVVVHPDLEIETARARAMLGDTVPLADAIRQWANLGALVDGLHRGDFALISRALEDTIAEPRRAPLVPGLATIKQAAVDAGRARLQPVRLGAVALRALRRRPDRGARGRRDDRGRARRDRRRSADLHLRDRSARRARRFRHALRNDRVPSTCSGSPSESRGGAPAVSLEHALFDGLAPDGSLYVPESIDRWTAAEIAALPSRSLTELAARVLRPYTSADIDEATLASIVGEGAELSDSARRSRARHPRARAVSRADARVQGRRRPRDGAPDGRAPRRRGADLGPRRHLRRHRAAPSRTPSTACRTCASSCSIRTAA